MKPIPLLWTNDDITVSQADQLQRQLDFLKRWQLPGIFFVIPKSHEQTIDKDSSLLRTIERARADGHEFYQHGYIHTPFESGFPPNFMLDFAPEVRQESRDRRGEIEKGHRLEPMMEMIESGQKIWQKAFGENSPGYRPGWGAICNNLYIALEKLEFQWVSSRVPSTTSWRWNQGRWDEPLTYDENIFGGAKPIGGLMEYPIGGDYAFQVPKDPDKIDAMVDLAMCECKYYHDHGWPMSICSHWHGLEKNDHAGYAVHEKLIPKLLDSGWVEPTTMTRLHAQYRPAHTPL